MDNLFDITLIKLSSIGMEGGENKTIISNSKFLILNLKLLILTFCLLVPFVVWGYPTDNSENPASDLSEFSNLGVNEANKIGFSLNEFAKSLFGSKLVLPEAQGLDISNLVSEFDDFVNAKSFSTKDISGSIKAVGILFIKLVILSISITLAIFKMLLGLVVNNF